MHSLRFTAKTSSNGVVERDFTVGEIPGVLWSPVSGSDHAPLVLMGHGGGLHKKTPGLLARARDSVITLGFTVVAIDAPGHGDRPRTAEDEQARVDLRQARAAGEIERFESISVRYGISLAERAVPEWQATLDALQKLPDHRPDPVPAPVGRRVRRPPIRSRVVRRLRVDGQDLARQPGHSSQHALGRGRQRVPGPVSRPGRYVTGLT